MKKSDHLALGVLGEKMAAKYLCSKGYKIIETNFKKKHGDIDIVACHKNILVFVEVKTRISNTSILVENSITRAKVQSLIKSAQYYCLRKGKENCEKRIDLLCVYISDNQKLVEIKHYKNISG